MMIGIRNKYSQTKVEWPNEYFAEMQRINILSKACIHIRRKQLSGKKRCAYQQFVKIESINTYTRKRKAYAKDRANG